MIPSFVKIPGAPFPVLPVGLHSATLEEIEQAFAYNHRQRKLFDGLMRASANLAEVGCRTLYLDGSFVTDKPMPGDFDACWTPYRVNPVLLEPVFSQFDNHRSAQKRKFGGEFFVSTTYADRQGRTYLDFFQVERATNQKGSFSLA